MKKKILLIIIFIICLLVFTSCEDKFEENLDKYVDKVIDKAAEGFIKDYNNNIKIAEIGTSHSWANIHINKEDNNIIGEFDYFAGRYEIAEIKFPSKNKMKLVSEINTDNDDFKIVLINSNRKVHNLFEGTGEYNKEIELEEGIYILKMVSKGSKGTFNIEFEDTEDIGIELINED